jgi:hypothetical protein
MRESVGNFHFECPVPSFKFCKMRFNRHLAILLASIDLTRNPSTRKRLTLTRPIYSFCRAAKIPAVHFRCTGLVGY